MTVERLMELRKSNQAPYNHEDYTVWLHNKIIEDIKRELCLYQEKNKTEERCGYSFCNEIMELDSLQIIK